jgi:mRNA-degrading endonuclease RelE of RelBE toxin-antitoxin system
VRWLLIWDPEAVSILEGLARRDPRLAQRIRQRVAGFAATGQGDIRKLSGGHGEWRLRIGDWRVIFVFDPPGSITILAISDRRDAYR